MSIKQASIFLCAVGCAALAWWPSFGHSRMLAVAATPTPAALAYDEITRMILPPATPPAPGSFQNDYAAIVNASSGQSQANEQARAGGLAGMVGRMMGGNVPGGNPMAMMTAGHLMRYTYYRGWMRTDDPVGQTATIEKCDEHRYITLNLAKKTYAIANARPACATPAMPMEGRGRAPAAQEPGTADLTMTSTAQSLGPMTIDGIATDGSDSSMHASMTNATGSCRDGSFSMSVIQYVSQIRVPRPYCPLPRTMSAAPMGAMGAGGGCKPTVHASGGGFINPADRLVMYSRIPVGAGGNGGNGAGMNMVIERGNVKWFGGAPAEALFAIPPGFQQEQ